MSSANDPASQLAAVPEPQEAVASEAVPGGAVSEPEAVQEEDDRVSRKLFLGVLVAFLLAVTGFFVQSQRIDGLRAEIGGLEGEVLGLTSELGAANARVQGFEAQRLEIHRSVQLVLEDVLALEAVAASQPPFTAPLTPQDALGEGATAESELP